MIIVTGAHLRDFCYDRLGADDDGGDGHAAHGPISDASDLERAGTFTAESPENKYVGLSSQHQHERESIKTGNREERQREAHVGCVDDALQRLARRLARVLGPHQDLEIASADASSHAPSVEV